MFTNEVARQDYKEFRDDTKASHDDVGKIMGFSGGYLSHFMNERVSFSEETLEKLYEAMSGIREKVVNGEPSLLESKNKEIREMYKEFKSDTGITHDEMGNKLNMSGGYLSNFVNGQNMSMNSLYNIRDVINEESFPVSVKEEYLPRTPSLRGIYAPVYEVLVNNSFLDKENRIKPTVSKEDIVYLLTEELVTSNNKESKEKDVEYIAYNYLVNILNEKYNTEIDEITEKDVSNKKLVKDLIDYNLLKLQKGVNKDDN